MCLPLPLPLAGAFLPAAHCGQSPGQMPPTGVKCLGGCIVRGQDGGEGAVFGQRTMFRAEAGAVRGWVCEGRSSSTATPPRGRCFPGRYGGGGTPPGPAQPLFPSSRLLRDREDLWFVPQGNACALGPCLARQRGSRAVVRTAWHLDGPGRLPSPGLHPALAALVRGLGEGTVSHRPLVLMSLVTSPWSSSALSAHDLSEPGSL